jgi:hypothetical protein
MLGSILRVLSALSRSSFVFCLHVRLGQAAQFVRKQSLLVQQRAELVGPGRPEDTAASCGARDGPLY